MKIVHIVAIVLSALHLVFTGLTGMVGLFADGGTPWERILISGVHPLAAAALLLVLIAPLSARKWPVWVVVLLLLVSISGDVAIYIAMSRGVIKGDAELAIVFAVVPVLGVVYLLARAIGPGRVSGTGQVG